MQVDVLPDGAYDQLMFCKVCNACYIDGEWVFFARCQTPTRRWSTRKAMSCASPVWNLESGKVSGASISFATFVCVSLLGQKKSSFFSLFCFVLQVTRDESCNEEYAMRF